MDLGDVVVGDVRWPASVGHPSLIAITQRELEDVFVAMGFTVSEGPEVESDWYNFEALNIPPAHPARGLWDTFYVDLGEPETVVLRTHTSPTQIHLMEEAVANDTLPIHSVMPGRCYRRDTPDARHLATFHQIEGLVVDRGITFADLRVSSRRSRARYFGPDIESRLRPGYFPFTEPSAEFEVTCTICRGAGCRTCSTPGWIELGGCGVLDPAVLAAVGIDGERVERIRVRLRHRPLRADATRDRRHARPDRERRPVPGAVLMKISLSWLREFVELTESTEELRAILDDLGLVVEGIEHVGEGLEDVVVARIDEIRAIEGADRVRLVVVDAGNGPLEIVCGAMNIDLGDHVPLAPVGAVLPGGFEIARRQMRGVTSNGMLCSARELGLGDDHGGLLLLDDLIDPGRRGEPARRTLDHARRGLRHHRRGEPSGCLVGRGRRARPRHATGTTTRVATSRRDRTATPRVTPSPQRASTHPTSVVASRSRSFVTSRSFLLPRGSSRASRARGCERSPTWSTRPIW